MKERAWLVALVVGAGLLIVHAEPAAGAQPVPPLGSAVVHASGGIGDDDPIELEVMRHTHDLQLLFALKGSGAYLADVKVSIYTITGERVLTVPSAGPFFFAGLPSGRYRIDADFRGVLISKSASVKQGGRRDLYFYWERE
jgi:hypothetical protein